jgi:hypothetical protein
VVRSCKALFHKLKKICKENDDVKFVLLNFEDNRKLARVSASRCCRTSTFIEEVTAR